MFVYEFVFSTFFIMLGNTSISANFSNLILFVAHISMMYILISSTMVIKGLALDSRMTLLNVSDILLRTTSHLLSVLKYDLL